ncbi:MAG: cell wall-binding repeat-containing protein, partial [Actinomycetia bacterium]|nr:cell wall-binding repeat-containing protein [Actinomycetes bacterium]
VVSSYVAEEIGVAAGSRVSIERIFGDNRFKTCIEVAKILWGGNYGVQNPFSQEFTFATGDNFPDALAGSSLRLPILLTSSLHPEITDYFLHPDTKDYLSEMFISRKPLKESIAGKGTILGGESAISKSTEEDIANILSGNDRGFIYQKLHIIDFKDKTPRHYYLDMRIVVDWIEGDELGKVSFDRDGIPLVVYSLNEIGGVPGGKVYNPVTIAQYALGSYEEYLHGKKEMEKVFLSQARWLKEKINKNGQLLLDFPIPLRNIAAPWMSAMAQGEAISVLIRAYVLTNETSYLEAAQNAFLPFKKELYKGGVVYKEGDNLWLEEYPEDPPTHVFNGFLFSLFGLYDLYRVTLDPEVKMIFNSAVDTLLRNINLYEKDGALLYQLNDISYANDFYQILHVEHLKALSVISGEKKFHEIAEKWKSYNKDL